jgi:hypothetical protein
MANEVTTSSAGELVAAEIVSRLVIDAAYSEAVMPSLVRVADISTENSLDVKFPQWPVLAALDLTEADDMLNSAVNTTSTSVSAAEVGIMITVTDMLLNSSSVLGGLEPYAIELGKALANKIDTDLLATVSSFTNTVGSTGVDITETNFLEAIYTLEADNAKGPFVAVLHPIQIHDLRVSIKDSAGSLWGGPSAPAGDLGAMASLYGVDVFQSTNCASVNVDADRQGVMMPLGNQSGIAYVLKTGINTELERDASLRATELVVTGIYGKGCVDTSASGGVKIITDHE